MNAMIKKTAPYVLGAAAVASAGLWLFQRTRTGLPEGAVPVIDWI